MSSSSNYVEGNKLGSAGSSCRQLRELRCGVPTPRNITQETGPLAGWKPCLASCRGLVQPDSYLGRVPNRGPAAFAQRLWHCLDGVDSVGLPSVRRRVRYSLTVVTLRDLTEHQIAQLNSVAVLLGVACFGVGCA